MRKFLIGGFFFSLFLFGLVLAIDLDKVKAVEDTTTTTNTKLKPISRCLQVKKCLPGLPESADCVVKSGHRVQLSTKEGVAPLIANHKTYINVCISYAAPGTTKMRPVCTTGDSQLDKEIHGVDNFSKLKNDLQFKMEAMDKVLGEGTAKTLQPLFDPATGRSQTVNTDSYSKIPILEWQDSTPNGHNRSFLAYQLVVDTSAIRTKQGGEQQAELDFLEDPMVCVPIGWDPDGRAFDAVTLDPIPDVSVKILKKNATTGVWEDPKIPPRFSVPTDIDGKYGYDVLDGEYKLQVAPPSNYSFPVNDLSKIHPNYKKVYLNPLSFTPGSTASATSIYPAQTGEIIKVAGAAQHADIPLLPDRKKGYQHKTLKVEFIEQRLLSGDQVVQGLSSHPFTKINVYIGAPSSSGGAIEFFKTYKSEYDGTFNITLRQQEIPGGKVYKKIDFQASDLTKTLSQRQIKSLANSLDNLGDKLVGEVEAQEDLPPPTASFDLQQIPAYLEGYAYDTSGKVMPNTTVGIYLTFSNKPSYETKTDEKGYFKVTSEFLPVMPYEIRYTPATGGSQINISPETFLSQNMKYLAENKINLYNYKNIKGTSEPPFFVGRQRLQETPGAGGQKQSENPTPIVSPQTSSPAVMIVLFVLTLLLIGVGAMLVLQMVRKNQSGPFSSPGTFLK